AILLILAARKLVSRWLKKGRLSIPMRIFGFLQGWVRGTLIVTFLFFSYLAFEGPVHNMAKRAFLFRPTLQAANLWKELIPKQATLAKRVTKHIRKQYRSFRTGDHPTSKDAKDLDRLMRKLN
ncbi:hypothetical protein ACQZV8_16390, partial [Magnetococcales bacterium HHB-1]